MSGTTHKIYLKAPAGLSAPCLVRSIVQMDGLSRSYERTLTPQAPWTLLARVQQDDTLDRGFFRLIDVSDDEVEAERQAIGRGGG